MKTLQLTVSALLLLVLHSELKAQTSFGFYGGLSTPSEQISNVYNSDSLKTENVVGTLKRSAANTGYHVGARLRLGLGEDLVFIGGISLSRFPSSKIDIVVPNGTDTIRTTLTSTQNIIPIAVGVNYYLTKKLIGVYAIGELSYNYLTNSIDGTIQGVNFPLDRSPTYNRVGFGLGAGMDIDLKLLTLNVEGKYNLVNFIGSEEGEKSKSFVTLSVGIYFGSTTTAKSK